MATSYSALCVILSLQQVLCAQNFTAVEWSAQTSSSSKCETAFSSSELTSAISTVAQMIANSIDYLPRSCLEIKNNSPESPSGYYAVMSDTSGAASIVYCDMDNLNSCPDLEQSLTGIMSSVETLTTTISGLHGSHESLNASVSDVQAGLDNLQASLQVSYEVLDSSIDNLQTEFGNLTASVSNVQGSIDGLQTDLDAFIASEAVTSCEDIKRKWPWTTSGWYRISSEDVYCDMEDKCGMAGPWRRVLYLDMTDPSQSFPDGSRLYSSSGVRVCGRPQGNSGCATIIASSTSSLSYSKICGRVIGYQFGSPDGFRNTGIDSPYMDGVSITRGSPRQHVWTLVNPWHIPSAVCSCNGGNNPNIPTFVGDDYYCESAVASGSYSLILYTDDPLWDGQGCTSGESDCCANPDLPWFHKDLGSSTTDYIELRVCGDENTGNEDTPVSLYEIYVQ